MLMACGRPVVGSTGISATSRPVSSWAENIVPVKQSDYNRCSEVRSWVWGGGAGGRWTLTKSMQLHSLHSVLISRRGRRITEPLFSQWYSNHRIRLDFMGTWRARARLHPSVGRLSRSSQALHRKVLFQEDRKSHTNMHSNGTHAKLVRQDVWTQDDRWRPSRTSNVVRK